MYFKNLILFTLFAMVPIAVFAGIETFWITNDKASTKPFTIAGSTKSWSCAQSTLAAGQSSRCTSEAGYPGSINITATLNGLYTTSPVSICNYYFNSTQGDGVSTQDTFSTPKLNPPQYTSSGVTCNDPAPNSGDPSQWGITIKINN